MELKIHGGKVRHQELLDGLHTLALIEVFPLNRDYSGQLQVAGYVFVQLHPGRPGVRGDYLAWVDVLCLFTSQFGFTSFGRTPNEKNIGRGMNLSGQFNINENLKCHSQMPKFIALVYISSNCSVPQGPN